MANPICTISSLTYAVIDLVTNLAPQYLTLDPVTSTLTVKSSDPLQIGAHSLILTYTLTLNPAMSVSSTYDLNFAVKIYPIPKQNCNFGPPVFVTPLNEVTMVEGDQISYVLPKTSDPDLYEVCASMKVELGAATAFAKYSNGNFTFSPQIGNAGFYQIKITLKDNNTNPLTSKPILKVNVIKKALPESGEKKVDNIMKVVNKDMEAFISSISNTGQVIISFNKNIIAPSNFSFLNDASEILNIYVSNPDSGKYKITKWNATSFTQRQIVL